MEEWFGMDPDEDVAESPTPAEVPAKPVNAVVESVKAAPFKLTTAHVLVGGGILLVLIVCFYYWFGGDTEDDGAGNSKS